MDNHDDDDQTEQTATKRHPEPPVNTNKKTQLN